MAKRKSNALAITAVVVLIAFGLTMLMPIVFAAFNKDAKDIPVPKQTDNDSSQQNTTQNNEAKYFTSSNGGNVDIGVIFMNPIEKDETDLVFKVMLNTHSVDLSDYSELNKYVKLKTKEITIEDGFVWDSDSSDGHHISGTLKIKNQYDGKPILDDKTEYIKLVFKNIAGVKEREHVYTKETLR
ncbi:hypothetical protein [Petroclostridium sp. X23]|uniref:hypothetical protein n=1 Tax=Petroclostridium sp. X23 TaxID=3045146 RepID=UPI0024AD8F7A|nr:hypothetical protein [Petroclostridium sp. X23]WHH59996.1 hypothetical protein QKW49_04390 [Petroclostridium sp. X23]